LLLLVANCKEMLEICAKVKQQQTRLWNAKHNEKVRKRICFAGWLVVSLSGRQRIAGWQQQKSVQLWTTNKAS